MIPRGGSGLLSSARRHVIMHPRTAADNALLLLVDDLRSGTYDIGSKLPSIRELSAAYAISHVNVRAALTRLKEQGVVQVQRGRGGGITVLGLSPLPRMLAELYDPVADEDLLALVEAWTILEREILLLANRRTDAESLAGLQERVARLNVEATTDPIEFGERTVHFHLYAATVAQNPFLRRQQGDILSQLALVFLQSRFYREMTPERRTLTLRHYGEIMDALERRDDNAIIATVHARHVLQLEMLFGTERAVELAERSRRPPVLQEGHQ